MSEMSNYLENALINHTLRNSALSAPSAVYVSLHTANPDEDASGSELSGSAYARQAATFASPSNGVSTTSGDINFPQATGSWGTVSHIGIWDASSSGNMLYYTALDASKTIATGDILKIAAGSLTVTLA
tara:strand:+ start:1123 stop:1509 length:387 start_codon:yes stop_codon:yes gene_type:complete